MTKILRQKPSGPQIKINTIFTRSFLRFKSHVCVKPNQKMNQNISRFIDLIKQDQALKHKFIKLFIWIVTMNHFFDEFTYTQRCISSYDIKRNLIVPNPH